MATAHFTDIALHIQAELKQARHSIKLAMAWLTNKLLLREMEAAAERGVRVEIVVSRHEFNKWERLERLETHGIQVALHGSTEPGRGNFLHHKFCVIDAETVITGSFNWSQNAGRNAENVTITHANQALAAQYLTEFQELWAEAVPLLAEFNNTQTASRSAFRFFNWRQPPEASLDPEDIYETKQSRAARVRLWADRLLGARGDKAVVYWQAPVQASIQLYGLGEAFSNGTTTLPNEGKLTVEFEEQARTISLVALTTEGELLAQRSIELLPAWLPLIEFELDRPTIVGRLMPAKLRWRVRHAETVRIEPGPVQDLPTEGELTVSPASSTTYTLIARGLGGEQRQSRSLGVFPVPTMSSLRVPVPTNLHTEIHLSYSTIPIPSGLDLRGTQLQLRLPTLQHLRSDLLPTNATPTLAELATGRGHDTPADLRWPTVEEADSPANFQHKRWNGWRLALLDRLELKFQHNTRLSYLLSTIRKLYA